MIDSTATTGLQQILKNRTSAYSISLMIAAAFMGLYGHVDIAVLNALAAIWFKMPYPNEVRS